MTRAWRFAAIIVSVVGCGDGGRGSGGGNPGGDAGTVDGGSTGGTGTVDGSAGNTGDGGNTGNGGNSGNGGISGNGGNGGADAAGSACLNPNSCDPNATCSLENGIDVCRCPAGWTGDGKVCTDIDECALDSNRCGNSGTCQNTAGGYGCDCPTGFQDVGGACVDVDECASGTDDCTAKAVCSNTVGSFRCTCPVGYVLGSGSCDVCERGYVETSPGVCAPGNIDCNVNSGICAPGGTCVSSVSGDSCKCTMGNEGLACGHCAQGYQDNDGDGLCAPSCDGGGLSCPAHEQCSDAGGTATCVCARGYTGTSCDQCDSGFGDHFGQGNCVALTCATSLLSCPTHSGCYDRSYPPACRCDIGWSGTACATCAPTHQDDGNGSCAAKTDLDPARYLLSAGIDDFDRPVLGAVDITTWSFLPLAQLEEPVFDLASDPMGPIYATRSSPNEVVRIDIKTGLAQTVATLGSYHGVNGLAFDSKRRRLYAGANIGASKYLLTILPDGTTSSGGASMDTLDELGMTYHSATDTVRGIAGYLGASTPLQTFQFDAATGGSGAAGKTIDIAPNLSAPGLAYLGDTLYVAGERADTEAEWAEAYCRKVSLALGVDTSTLTGDSSYDYNGIAASGNVSITSDPSGPRLHARGSYGDQSAARATLGIDTTEAGDVVCIATREENLDVVVAATARFRLLLVVSSFATPHLQIEAGFSAAAGAANPPIRAYGGSTADPSFGGSLVKTYDSNAWYALKLPYPSYDPLLAPFPLAGTLDWTSAATVTHAIAGVALNGGLTGMPCCTTLAAPAFCDGTGRVAAVTGTCDPAGACQSKTAVLDDCTDRTLHPLVYACTSAGAVKRTPTCVAPGAADAACQFVDSVLDACDAGGSCTGGSGALQYTSAEKCVATSSNASCTTTVTPCTDKGPECLNGSVSTYATSCGAASGCAYTPSVTPCSKPAAYCSAGPPLEHVGYTATCADTSSCGSPTETRTTCQTSMCVGNDWVTYGTPSCDPVLGCGGNEIARQDCTAGDTHVCATSKDMKWTRCGCVPGTGCVCNTTVDPCPDKPDQCVGTSGTTLRTYDPYCDNSTNTCTWNSPDAVCPNFCSGGRCF